MKKHTKGKWHTVEYAGFYNIQNKPTYQGKNLLDAEDVGVDEAKANALLMTEAPVLLETVEKLQKRLENLIKATPSGAIRNRLTVENIHTLARESLRNATPTNPRQCNFARKY